MAAFGFFKYSRLGLAMRATAFNQQVAQSLGVSIQHIFIVSWAISALVSGVAGVVVGVVGGISPGLSLFGIKVFPAVILGGLRFDRRRHRRRHRHRLLENLAQFVDGEYLHWGNLFAWWRRSCALVLVLMLQPYGLFGTRDIERICSTGASRRCGDFRTRYDQEMTWFPGPPAAARLRHQPGAAAAGTAGAEERPGTAEPGPDRLPGHRGAGLNLVTGFAGQISLGHAAFFGVGAFASAWLSNRACRCCWPLPPPACSPRWWGWCSAPPAQHQSGAVPAIATLAAHPPSRTSSAAPPGSPAARRHHRPAGQLFGFVFSGDVLRFYR